MENKVIVLRSVYGKVKECHLQPCKQSNGTNFPFVKPVRYDSNGNMEMIMSDKERASKESQYFIPEDEMITITDGAVGHPGAEQGHEVGAGNEEVHHLGGFVLRHEEHPRHVGDEDAPHSVETESFAGLIAHDVFCLCRQGHDESCLRLIIDEV